MGFLTTITFYNDTADKIIKYPKELSRTLSDACSGIKNTSYFGDIIIQKPRHADDETLFLHSGNTVIDVYDAKNEWAIDSFIKNMEYHLKRLKKIRKDNNEDKNI